ncbi:MAG: amidohydrolase family protein [Phycisphaerae bacterium]|nr:amidohydrolase family protein [Phycisphaerae bacterium]
MIINVHTHVYTNPAKPDSDELFVSQMPVPKAVQQWRDRGVDHVCVCPGGRLTKGKEHDNGNDVVESLCADYGDFFIGFGRVRPEKDKPEYIDELADRGFKGLKFIAPLVPYDDESSFPFYEKASKHGLVCLFHLGWLGHRPGRRADHVIRVANMQPVHLDAIGRYFSELKLVGAHFGGRAYCLQAVTIARWMPNVYFDLTGGIIRRLPWPFLQMLFGQQKEESLVDDETVLDGRVMEKIIFGSDNALPDVFLTFYKNLMERFDAPPQMQQAVMGDTLAGLLGL